MENRVNAVLEAKGWGWYIHINMIFILFYHLYATYLQHIRLSSKRIDAWLIHVEKKCFGDYIFFRGYRKITQTFVQELYLHFDPIAYVTTNTKRNTL